MTYTTHNTTYSANTTYESSSSGSSLYVLNNKVSARGACRGTCRSMGVCTCS